LRVDGNRAPDQWGNIPHAGARCVCRDAGERCAKGGGDLGLHRYRLTPPRGYSSRRRVQPHYDPLLLFEWREGRFMEQKPFRMDSLPAVAESDRLKTQKPPRLRPPE
jgi:hypothetical protein